MYAAAHVCSHPKEGERRVIYAQNIFLCLMIPFLITVIFLRGDSRRFVVFLTMGIMICLISSCIGAFLSMVGDIGDKDAAIYISPIVEEIMKFSPLLFYMLLFEPTNGQLIIMGMGIGAGFATFENSCYILTSGAENLSYILVRGMAVGVMHIISILILIIGLMMIRYYKAESAAAAVGALSLSVTFHALYNLLVSEPGLTTCLGYSLPLVSAGILYIPYRRILQR